jgi:dihydrofolate reductase
MKIALIVAMAQNGVIGRDNKMPWHLSEDLKYFKKVTMGKPVIMGRNTFESIGKPLPGRDNIIISRNPDYEADGISVVGSVEDALDLASQLTDHDAGTEIMIVGGAQIYAQTLPLAQRLYLTEVHADVHGDARFPAFNRDEWRLVAREDHPAAGANPYAYSFLVLDRRM